MFKSYYSMILFLIFTHLLLFGCAKPPTEEMIKAEKAIDEARDNEAEIFANDIFSRTEESFQTAKKSVAERSYEEARLIALDTIRFAGQAVAIAQINKEKIVNETERSMEDVQIRIDELKKIEARAFGKKALIKHDELKERLTMHEAELENIKHRLKNNEVMAARNDLKALYSEIEELEQKVSVSLKTKKKKR